jgi:uncharacterized protein
VLKRSTRQLTPEQHLSSGILALLLAAAGILGGCNKQERAAHARAAQVHTITRQMARAAAPFAHDSDRIEVHEEFDGVHAERRDRIRIVLSRGPSEQRQHEELARLEQALGRVATANALTRNVSRSEDSTVHLEFRRGPTQTHSIEIAMQGGATPPSEQSANPRLAIILDDLGNDRAAAEAIFALSCPITLSVLPNHPHSAEIAEEAHRRGYEVMLHLPMQSVANETPEPQELRPGMTAGDVAALVDQLLQTVPDVSGVNNHQGSQSTADVRLMNELMPVLREHNLFYVDSRTTAATMAYDSAQRAGVPSSFRNTPFLDDVAELAPVRRQLQLALRNAQQKGEAIAIGHPHPATLQALKEVLPEAKAQGIELVFASELVH